MQDIPLGRYGVQKEHQPKAQDHQHDPAGRFSVTVPGNPEHAFHVEALCNGKLVFRQYFHGQSSP